MVLSPVPLRDRTGGRECGEAARILGKTTDVPAPALLDKPTVTMSSVARVRGRSGASRAEDAVAFAGGRRLEAAWRRPSAGERMASRWWPAAGGMAMLLVGYAVWQLGPWHSAGNEQLIGDAFFYPVGGAAVLTAWRASRRCAAWPRLGLAWRLLALAAFAYLCGDIAQTGYELAGLKPYPSAADGCYLAFYPLMLAGVLAFPATSRRSGQRLRLGLDLAVVALGGSAVVIYVVLGPSALAGGQPLQAAFSVAYPVGDMVLLVGLASLLLRGSAPSARRALQLLALGMAFYVAADLVYGYITLHSAYEGGDPVDSLWMVAIALTAVAGAAQPRVDGPAPLRASGDGAAWVPYAGVGVTFAVLVFSDRHDPFFPGLTMTLVALVLVGLVALRQFLAQRDLAGAQGALRHQALHDALTGLPNRLLASDRAEQLLTRARRAGVPAAVLYLDLDGFKHVNDSFGHAAGDRLLESVAARLSTVVRASDTVARLGGDEFLVLLDASTLDAGAELVAERILAVLAEPVELNGSTERTVRVTASIGLALGLPEDAEQLIREADLALYQAKEAGKNRYVVYQPAVHAASGDRFALQLDLHEAIARDELHLLYQPVFDLRTHDVVGMEALLRWRHPERGTIGPDQFVPTAEETGLIVTIGRWVLHRACEEAAAWRERGHRAGVAVNISARQLDTDALVADVREALERSRLDASALTLEITETALMHDVDAAAGRLAQLKDLGIRIAIDDFGTGYSSLAHLRRFSVDEIKIDRSFVSGIATSKESGALIHTLIQLGKTLGLETLGEGIEEPAQLRRLRGEHCDRGQGYLLARPLEADSVERFLAARR